MLEDRIRQNALHSSILAYRSVDRKSNIELALDAFQDICSRRECTVVALDVRGFFDSINHEQLIRELKSLQNVDRLSKGWFKVIRAITRFSYIERREIARILRRPIPRRWRPGARICKPSEFRQLIRPALTLHRTGVGIPQGSPISAVLANVFMFRGDLRISRTLRALGWSYRRYSDDVLIIGPTECASEAVRAVEDELRSCRLEIQPEKTQQGRFSDGCPVVEEGEPGLTALDYLGLVWDGKQVGIREASIHRFEARMRSRVQGIARGAEKAGAARLGRRKLFKQFSHLGPGPVRVRVKDGRRFHGNFVTYLMRASKKAGSSKVQKRAGRYWLGLNELIEERQRYLMDKVE